jgi:hypothetical protein
MVFFDYVEVVPDEYASEIKTIDHHLYLQVFGCLHDQCFCKLLQRLECGKWKICNDDVPVQSVQLMWHFLSK